MNDQPLDELTGNLRQAVECWRDRPVPETELDQALVRLLSNEPDLRWRSSRLGWLLPPAIAATLAAMMVFWVPSAFAALAETVREPMKAMLPPGDAELRASWRPVMLIHVGTLMGGYFFFVLSWGVTRVDLFLRLCSIRWLSRAAPRLSVLGAVVGTISWAVGVILGCFWASAILGRFWGWDPPEVSGLITLAAGLAWSLGGWRLRGSGSVLPAVIATLAFWVVVHAYWWALVAPNHAIGVHSSGWAIEVCTILDLLLVATAWVTERRRALLT